MQVQSNLDYPEGRTLEGYICFLSDHILLVFMKKRDQGNKSE